MVNARDGGAAESATEDVLNISRVFEFLDQAEGSIHHHFSPGEVQSLYSWNLGDKIVRKRPSASYMLITSM
jgi:hypothetical protein